jgi:hypothetical protein
MGDSFCKGVRIPEEGALKGNCSTNHSVASVSSIKAVARTYFVSLLQQVDPMLEPWREAILGDPELVRTVELEPSYWVVPVVRQSQVLGYIEVSRHERVLGHAYFYQNPHDLSSCPRSVTRLSSDEAYKQAQGVLKTYSGAKFTNPMFVHDGPHNRLAWMIEVHFGDELVSRVFVTPGYVYERKAGTKPLPPGWRGRLT